MNSFMATYRRYTLVLFFTLLIGVEALGQSISSQRDDNKSNRWQHSYLLESKGQYEQAAAVLTPFLNHAGTSEMAWLRYGWLNYLQGNYNNAIDAYKTALKKNTHSIDARLGLTLPLIAQQRWNEAKLYAQQVTNDAGWNYTAQLRLLTCDSGLKLWQEVRNRAANLAMRYPSEYTPWLFLGRAENWLGNIDAANDAYQQVLMRVPDNYEANRFVLD